MTIPSTQSSQSSFEDLSITELQERAAKAGLKNFEGLSKKDLIIALRTRNR